MRSALILATTFATTFAHGPQADRRLPAWSLDSGLVGDATGGHNECHFRSTAALFAKTWTTNDGTGTSTDDTATGTSLAGTALDSINMVEGGGYHSNKRVSTTDWTNTSHPILIARFDVDLTLDNYAAATQNANTKNYVYYDYHNETPNPGWKPTKLDATGKEKMTSICVYKKGHTVPPECANDIKVEVDDSGVVGVPGTPVNVQLGVRKTLGIATTCGESARGGDLGGTLNSGSEDIFVWGTLSAQQDFNFVLTRNDQGPDAHSGYPSGGVGSGATPNEDTKDGLNYISISLAVTQPEPVTHDLLFIEKHVDENNYLFQSHPGCTVDSAGKCEDHTEYRIDIQAEPDESTGGISISAATKSMTCDVALTVVSGRPNHWHCFRDTASQVVPGTSHDSTDFTTTPTPDGKAALDDLQAQAAAVVAGSNGVCTAQLTVNCGSMSLTVTGTDNRRCDFSSGFGADAPQVDSGGASGNNAAELARQEAYKSCVTSAWFQDKFYFKDDIMLTGKYNAAIVQAVRLTNTRRYPKDASNSAIDITVGNLALGTAGSFNVASTQWECTTNDCADEDPYKVLKTSEVTATSKFNEALTFVTDDSQDTKGASLSYNAGAVGDGTAGNNGNTADLEITTTCTCVGTSASSNTPLTCCNNGPDYDSLAVPLVNPPSGFPESYVFGVVSFDFRSNHGDSKDYDLFVRPGGVEAAVPDASGQRRLLRSSAPRGVQKTLLVNAVQNVINK